MWKCVNLDDWIAFQDSAEWIDVGITAYDYPSAAQEFVEGLDEYQKFGTDPREDIDMNVLVFDEVTGVTVLVEVKPNPQPGTRAAIIEDRHVHEYELDQGAMPVP